MRILAAALAPAYLRVSGTWANTTYFADTDDRPALPPPGFNGVLTRAQWRGVVEFAHAVDARIVTSFAIGAGTRDAAGVWSPDQARRLLGYTRAAWQDRRRRIHERAGPRRPSAARPRGMMRPPIGRDFNGSCR